MHSFPRQKPKIERPYGRLQDRLIRTCVRENVTDIKHARQVLTHEVHRYNHPQVHSTTREVPSYRVQRAFKEQKSLFREFEIKPPFQSVKDIFCFRISRKIDAYRRISLDTLQLKVKNATPHERVILWIYPLNAQLSEVRFWCKNRLIDVQNVKISDLKTVHF